MWGRKVSGEHRGCIGDRRGFGLGSHLEGLEVPAALNAAATGRLRVRAKVGREANAAPGGAAETTAVTACMRSWALVWRRVGLDRALQHGVRVE